MKMEYLVLIIIILVPLLCLFNFLLNSHPLTNNEINELAHLRRFSDFIKYFNFASYSLEVNKNFKSNLDISGSLYYLNEGIEYFPSLAAKLLKGKKHEWIIFAFVNEKRITGMWVNKGQNNLSVSSSIGLQQILQDANFLNATSILEFHNHPNAVLFPSDADLKHTNDCGSYLVNKNMNYLSFIVGKGQYIQYGWWMGKNFLSSEFYITQINKDNEQTRSQNFSLRKELRKKLQNKNLILNRIRSSHNF